MKKIKRWKHEKKFDTKTLITDIVPVESESSDQTRKAVDLRTISDAENKASSGVVTQIYEPRPLTPDDDIYDDIIEQFASAPTKPKYWFEEFGDYWSCSCGHINKGDKCKSCGLERDLLRSLFILHKPADSPGKLNKKLNKATKEKIDKEEQQLADKEKRRKQREAAGDDILTVIPIETAEPYEMTDVPETAESSDIQASANSDKTEDITSPCEDTEHNTSFESSADTDNLSDSSEPIIEKDNTKKNNKALLPVVTSHDKTQEKHNNRYISFKKKIIISIIACIILIGGGGVVIYHYLAAPAMQYQDAQKLQANGKYEKAIAKYKALGDYKDCDELIWECYCSMGDEYFKAGEFNKAIETYNTALELKEDDSLHDKIWKCYCGIGDDYFEAGKFDKAIETYNTALEQKEDDSLHDKIWKCYCSIGDSYIADGNYEDGLDTYYIAADIKDNETIQKKINAAKFSYVKKYQADRTAKVEEYMSDLMAVGYSGIQEIYDSYYEWHTKIIANTSEDDKSSDLDTISRKDTVYFHISLSGGEPSEAIALYYEVTWPNGNSQISDLDSTWKAGSEITARFQYPIPLFGKEGKLTFTLYDKSTNEKLGSDSVTFKN